MVVRLQDVHDDLAELEEAVTLQVFGEEVGEVVVRVHEGNASFVCAGRV